MHGVVRHDQIEVTVGKTQVRAVHLVKMHRCTECFGAGMRIAKHASTDVDRMYLGLRKGQCVRHAGRPC